LSDYDRYRRALDGLTLPAALVDLDALDHNHDELVRQLGGRVPLRLAHKSLRVPALARYLLDRGQGALRGVMTYRAAETRLLAERGFDDLLLAYPISRRGEATDLAVAATRATVRVVVDDEAHLHLLSAAAQGAGSTLGVCLDLDVALRPGAAGAHAHLGVLRSPLRDAAAALALARKARELPGLRVDSVMAYEAQVAGLADDAPAWKAPVLQWIKRSSVSLARERRAEVVRALRADGFPIAVVNGGGTGSVDTTSRDPTVTEVTAGSGFLCTHLFDGYRALSLRPALFCALAVVRRPDAQHVTVAGGGLIASGPTGADRSPVVWAPEGLSPVPMEGFGEVQTPLRLAAHAPRLTIGDPVFVRPAKAGEPAERFSHYHLVRGDRVVEVVPTLRGLGHTSP
jgi:D-serine deaminase-like pyridoxal phosphate-dependent protein